LHSGSIGAQGGSFTIENIQGQSSYNGSTAHGVTTGDWGSYQSSFRVISNYNPYGQQQYGGYQQQQQSPQSCSNLGGSSYSCRGKNNGCSGGRVWGSGVYTTDSNICAAALHSGAIGAHGGYFTTETLQGQSSYNGSTAHGITSDNWGSYQSSFRVVGSNPYGQPQQQQYGQPQQQYGQPQQQYGQQQQQQGWNNYYSQIGQQAMDQYQQIFAQLDTNRGGSITALELCNATFVNAVFSLETAVALIKAFDRDRSGVITFDEFATLYQFVVKLHQAFVSVDLDRSGYVDQFEMSQALAMEQLTFNPNTIANMLVKFGGQQGRLNFEQFVRLSSFLALVKATFFARDLHRIGSVPFTVEEFVDLYSQL